MKRLIIVFSIITLLSSTMLAQERRALLIGIGEYGPETGWNTIHGDNDVEIIKDKLIQNSFKQANITTLTGSNATFDGINNAMHNLLQSASKQDVIYIQFSGHGQQITDLDGDEEDGLDEAWVPYDAYKAYSPNLYIGQRHITDDYIYEFLQKLRKKIGEKGKIIVISDACHSGGGSRGNDDTVIRGTKDSFLIPGNHQLFKPSKITYDWLFVAACKPYQNNYEYKNDEGKYCGMLTYMISCDSHDFSKTDYKTLIEGWKQTMSSLSRYPQTITEDGKPSSSSDYLF